MRARTTSEWALADLTLSTLQEFNALVASVLPYMDLAFAGAGVGAVGGATAPTDVAPLAAQVAGASAAGGSALLAACRGVLLPSTKAPTWKAALEHTRCRPPAEQFELSLDHDAPPLFLQAFRAIHPLQPRLLRNQPGQLYKGACRASPSAQSC